jgi:hypothetical protein
MGKPRNWTPIPGIHDLLSAFTFQIPLLPALFLAILFLAALEDSRSGPAVPQSSPTAVESHRLALLHLGYALIAVVPLVFAFSRVAVSLFLDRYLLPAGLGMTVVLADFVSRICTRAPTDRTELIATRFGFGAIAVVFILFPIYRAITFQTIPRPGVQLGTMTFSGRPVTDLPVAVEANLEYLPLVYYAQPGASPYFFILDWETAIDPHSDIGAPMANKAMQVFRRQHYYADGIVESATFLCAHDRFAVIDGPRHLWLERRVLNDTAFSSTVVGTLSTMHDAYTVRVVERRPGRLPRECAAGNAPSG